MTPEEMKELFRSAGRKQETQPQPEEPLPEPEKTSAAPEKTTAAPEKTVAAPEKTVAAPEKTAAAPEKTAAAPEKTAAAGPGLEIPTPDSTRKPGDTVTVGGKTYTVVEVIGSGSEGDLYVVKDNHRKYALKLCHKGFKTNEAVLKALGKMKDKDYLLPGIVSFGPDYELMEYLPSGSVAKENLKGNAEAILAIVTKVAFALDRMHKAGVLHKDVKPANILIRNKEGWDVVLCDFGIADIIGPDGLCKTSQARTRIYAAPEVYAEGNTITIAGVTTCELTHKADFYSLGMTILSLWMGESAFMSKEHEMALDKVKGRIAIPADMPDPLARICRGLLIRNPEKRWNLDEIERTLDGKEVEVEEDLINEDLDINYNASKHLRADTPEELAACMADDLDLASQYLYRGQIEKWLKPYPELVMEIQEIVEKRYPKDRKTGTAAVMFFLDPARPIALDGFERSSGEAMHTDAVTLKDVSNFCCKADLDADTADMICSDIFREWVRVRSKDLAAKLPTADSSSTTYLLRIQTIDPLSDINLINDPENPNYAMTGEDLGALFNDIYTIYWNTFEGDLEAMLSGWVKGPILKSVAANIVVNFLQPLDYHYVRDALETKGQRFSEQIRWFKHCVDRYTDDVINRAGPKDDTFFAQSSWMKCIQGFGYTPEYEFVETGKIASDHKSLFSHSKKELLKEYRDCGLKGFLAVLNQEDPDADLRQRFAYESLLKDYLDDVGYIDPDDPAVLRFDEASEEAERLLSEGRGRIRKLNASSITQTVLTIVFAIVPSLVLLAMLIFSIIDNPLVDVSGLKIGSWIWILGIVIGVVIYFTANTDGGLIISIIGGVIVAAILMIAVKFLGMFILYMYAAVVLAVLIWFSIKTVFNWSPFARKAKKFTKPGFDEKVLEPLYYAYSNETSFDSSLNGAFNQNDIDNWRLDLKNRRRHTIIFIAAVWVLMIFSGFIPKSERLGKFASPFINKVVATQEPDLLDVESIAPGAKGEDVRTLQQFLLDAGYVKNKPDGDYGPGTKKAVQAFQKANGLDPTGVADNETIKTINKVAHEMQ